MANESETSAETQPDRPKLPNHWRKVKQRTNTHMLYAEDLGGPETKVDVEISEVTIEKVKNEDGTSDMLALSFTGAKKKLGLSSVFNLKRMKKLSGTDDPNQWKGWITLVVVSEKIAGEPTDCIRIAPRRPEPKVKP